MASKCKKCGNYSWDNWWIPVSWRCWGHTTNRKVSELEKLSVDDINIDDVIYIVDTSEKMSKKIRVGDLLEYVKRNK